MNLDLSRCCIQSRGLGRLLHGLRIGRVFGLEQLFLRGNNINSRGIDFLGASFATGALNNLKLIDLRGNFLCIYHLHMFTFMFCAIARK